MDKLSEFVNEQIKHGVKPEEMKNHLLMNGWKEDQIDDAIHSALHRRTRGRVLISVFSLILVGILVLALLSIVKNTTPEVTAPIPVNTPGETFTPTTTENGGCSTKESSLEKDDCYKQLLKTGFDCRTLEDKIENTYCTRAQEDLLLKGVDRIEEG